jgi:ABC-type polar amino acid transport system ATPase subunit
MSLLINYSVPVKRTRENLVNLRKMSGSVTQLFELYSKTRVIQK